MINYGKHFIDRSDIKHVLDTLNSDWLTQGPKVKIFEDKLKKFLNSKYSLAVNSGTAALHLACISIGLKKDDIVLTTPITFLSSINSALYLNAKPVFVDINPKNYCLDLDKLQRKLEDLKNKKKRVKALIVTDYAGQMCDWEKIKKLSKKFKFFTINDNCHSLGSKYKNDQGYAVKFADIVTHSFHPVKIITTGEGGCLSTNNFDIYKKALELRSHGVIRSDKLKKKYGNWFYSMVRLGYNYRMPDINASLGISQLKKIKKFILKRKSIAKDYFQGFRNNKNIVLPFIENFCDHSFHLFPIQIKFKELKITKKIFFDKMLKHNINLQVHYIPIYLQKYYKEKFKFRKKMLSEAENFYSNAVSLPIYYSLDKKKIQKIIKNINLLTQ